MMTKKMKLTTHKEEGGYITEFNCFRWVDDSKEYFGIQIEPTKDLGEAIEKAREENEYSDDVWAVGVFLDGKKYGEGMYNSFDQVGMQEDSPILL